MPELGPDDWIAIALAAPAIGALVAWLAVPACFERLGGVLPGRPANDATLETLRLARAYERSHGGVEGGARPGDWRAVLAVRRDETSLAAVEAAYRERLALLQARRDHQALNGLHRAVRDARAALR